MRFAPLLAIAVALPPWPRALADGVAGDAPVLAPPGFLGGSEPITAEPTPVHMVPPTATTSQASIAAAPVDPFDGLSQSAPVLPPPGFGVSDAHDGESVYRPIAERRLTLGTIRIPAYPGEAPTEPRPGAAQRLAPATLVIPTIAPEVVATEAPYPTVGGCAPCQSYPSCGYQPLRPQYWFAGAEATFLGVHADSGGQTTVIYDDTTFPGTEVLLGGGSGHDGLSVSPRLWLGRQFGSRWAVCGRFWTLNDSDSVAPIPAFPVTNIDGLAAGENTRTELDAVDLEAICNFARGAWTLDAAFGVRHAELESSTALTVVADLAGPNAAGSRVANETSFYGTGLTGSLMTRRRLGSCGAQLIANGRGSVLWGDAVTSSSASSVVSMPPLPPLGPPFADGAEDDGSAWIGEVQFGLQWDVPVEFLRAIASFRIVGEYQCWLVDADVASAVEDPLAFGSITTRNIASSDAGQVDLYGLALAAGLYW